MTQSLGITGAPFSHRRVFDALGGVSINDPRFGVPTDDSTAADTAIQAVIDQALSDNTFVYGHGRFRLNAGLDVTVPIIGSPLSSGQYSDLPGLVFTRATGANNFTMLRVDPTQTGDADSWMHFENINLIAGSGDSIIGLRIAGASYVGVHSGAGNASVLTNTDWQWKTDELVGLTITNVTDGSSGTISANTATTVTATLSGGAENDWDVDDEFSIATGGTTSHSIIRRIRTRFCQVGMTLNTFISNIEACYGSSNQNDVRLFTANGVNLIGGEFNAGSGIGIDIRDGANIGLYGTVVEKGDGATGIRIAEGVGTVLCSNIYMEGHNLSNDETTGRHILAGTINQYGNTGTGDPNDAILGIEIRGGNYVGSSSPGGGYKTAVSMMEFDNVNSLQLPAAAQNKGSIKLGRVRNLRGLASGPWNTAEGAYGNNWKMWEDTAAKGFALKPILNYVVNPNGNGGPRGWSKVDNTNVQASVEDTAIVRSASTSLELRQATTDSGFPRYKFFPINQTDIASAAPGKFWVVGCWIYADTVDSGNEPFVQASYRDDGAEQNKSFSYSNSSTHASRLEADRWMFYMAWIEVVDDASTLTDFAIYISPSNNAASPSVDQVVYVADMFATLHDGPLSGEQIAALATDTRAGMMLGNAVHYYGSAAPTGANVDYDVGDITWNTGVSAAGTLLWACTTAGTGAGATWTAVTAS